MRAFAGTRCARPAAPLPSRSRGHGRRTPTTAGWGAPGQMTQGEADIIQGGGSQTSTSSRWGDYSMLAVDPSDGCTFWATLEYQATNGTAPWRTRIASFKFPNCGSTTT